VGIVDVLAHESWFTSARPPYDWGFATAPQTLALIVGALAITVLWRYAARRLPSPELRFLTPLGYFSPWVPRLLAIHAGVSLVALSARGWFLAPSLNLPDDVFGAGVRVAQGLVGVWLISGFRIRWAAVAVGVAGAAGMLAYGAVPILERLDLLAIAVFLAVLPPGRDRWGAAPADPASVGPAVMALRVLAGASLIVLAFTEKLARPELALAFLDRFPAFNLLRTVGLPISDVAFVRIAGAIELLFGLLLISGAAPQLVVIVAGMPFNATLFFLGSQELIGHLPIYGVMLALLVYGSDPILSQVVPRFAVGTAGADRSPPSGEPVQSISDA
jgi:hypothetical protein